MSRHTLCLVALLTTALTIVTAAGQQAPVVGLGGTTKGGLDAPLATDIEVDLFGRRSSSSQSEWTHDGTNATPLVDSADIRYETTFAGPGSDQGLSSNEDWVVTTTWERDDQGAASHRVWALFNSGGDRLFDFQAQGTGNVRLFHDGTVITDFGDFPVSAGVRRLTLHYKADEQDLAFWIDDILTIASVSNKIPITTSLDFDHMLLRSQNGGPHTSRDQYSLVKAGQLFVPPVPVGSIIKVVEVPLVEFESENDMPQYSLQSSTVAVGGVWVDTGTTALGDGSDLVMADPDGPSGALFYRAVRTDSLVADAVLEDTLPGLNVLFDSNIEPTNWGARTGKVGTWSVSNGFASAVNTATAHRLTYVPTDMGATTTNALPDDGWVGCVTFQYTGSLWTVVAFEGTYKVFLAGPESVGISNTFRVFNDGEGSAMSEFVLSEFSNHTLVVFYQGTNSGDLVDIWMDGVKIVSNHDLKDSGNNGPYMLDQVTFGGGNASPSFVAVDKIIVAPPQTGPVAVATSSGAVQALELCIGTDTGKSYNLRRADDLLSEFSSIPVFVTGAAPTGGIRRLYDLAGNSTSRFYAAQEQQ